MEKQPPLSPHDLLEAFKARPEIRSLIAGGHPVEYSAHLIPEGGFRALPRLVTDGMIVVGDAAGLALNMGVTVRGLDFALASGAIAAQALLRAREQGDFSAASLAYYETLLKDSFVWQDLQTFQHMPDFFDNPRLFEHYPSVFCDLLEQIMTIGEGPKEKISSTILRAARRDLLRADVLRDLLRMRRI
jgi:electron transfer flavoprotein-quinone oxidoreductase